MEKVKGQFPARFSDKTHSRAMRAKKKKKKKRKRSKIKRNPTAVRDRIKYRVLSIFFFHAGLKFCYMARAISTSAVS